MIAKLVQDVTTYIYGNIIYPMQPKQSLNKIFFNLKRHMPTKTITTITKYLI